jgi:hypothetical protein
MAAELASRAKGELQGFQAPAGTKLLGISVL